MRGVECRCGDVHFNGLGIGPDASAFFAGDVLDDFVEDGGDDEGRVCGGGSGGVALVGEVGADGDEECALLYLFSSGIGW